MRKTIDYVSHKPHPLQGEEGSGHTATIELSPWQNAAMTNEIQALCRLHSLSWSSKYTSQCV